MRPKLLIFALLLTTISSFGQNMVQEAQLVESLEKEAQVYINAFSSISRFGDELPKSSLTFQVLNGFGLIFLRKNNPDTLEQIKLLGQIIEESEYSLKIHIPKENKPAALNIVLDYTKYLSGRSIELTNQRLDIMSNKQLDVKQRLIKEEIRKLQNQNKGSKQRFFSFGVLGSYAASGIIGLLTILFIVLALVGGAVAIAFLFAGASKIILGGLGTAAVSALLAYLSSSLAVGAAQNGTNNWNGRNNSNPDIVLLEKYSNDLKYKLFESLPKSKPSTTISRP